MTEVNHSGSHISGGNAVANARRKPRQERKDVEFYSFKKLGNNWSVLAGTVKKPGVNPQPIRRFVKKVRLEPQKPAWHPISEFRFNNQLLVSIIGDRSGLGDPYDIVIHMLLRTLFVYPVLLPFALTAALSPPQIAPVTSYLPVWLYAYLLFALTRGLFKRSEN